MRSTPTVRAELLVHFKGLGYTLRGCLHPLRLGNHPAQIVKVCRQYGVNFPDLDEVEAEVREAKRKR